jgi:hypothetical protein
MIYSYLFSNLKQSSKYVILEKLNKILHFSDIQICQVNEQIIIKNKKKAVLDFNNNLKSISN